MSSEAVGNYLNAEGGIRSWLTTLDHKRIGILYLMSVVCFFGIGALAIAMVRTELIFPEGYFMTNETYNRLFSIHGIVMVWFFLIPSIPTTLGNFLLPLMLGTDDLAFPRLNLASWYLFIIGGAFAVAAIIAGGVDTGWTFYTPFSSFYSNSHIVLAITGVVVSGFSSIFTGLNFIVTTHRRRAPGLTWFRLPLFVWSLYATSIILVLATPVLALVLLLVLIERVTGMGIFDPKLGGDPLLFQHLFWFYSHPAVYIMILPGMGVVSELIPCFAKRRMFGYSMVAASSLAIAGFGFLLWGHHMFVSSQSAYAGFAFSILSYTIAIPSAIKVLNWTATLYKGRIELTAPMLYALGFIGLFTVGGLTGLFLASISEDVHLHDTYFVVGHFHYIMVGGTVMAFLGGLHFWWAKLSGTAYPEALARFSAISTFIGFNVTFFPQLVLGYMGNPRRYHMYAHEFQPYHIASTLGAAILAIGYVLPFLYFVHSWFWGRPAAENPWGAKGLEWETSSPPIKENFRDQPDVREGPYAYDQQ